MILNTIQYYISISIIKLLLKYSICNTEKLLISSLNLPRKPLCKQYLRKISIYVIRRPIPYNNLHWLTSLLSFLPSPFFLPAFSPFLHIFLALACIFYLSASLSSFIQIFPVSLQFMFCKISFLFYTCLSIHLPKTSLSIKLPAVLQSNKIFQEIWWQRPRNFKNSLHKGIWTACLLPDCIFILILNSYSSIHRTTNIIREKLELILCFQASLVHQWQSNN